MVQEVMEATVTAPWSSSKLVPSDSVTGTFLLARSGTCSVPCSSGGSEVSVSPGVGCTGSEPAMVDSTAWSRLPLSGSPA